MVGMVIPACSALVQCIPCTTLQSWLHWGMMGRPSATLAAGLLPNGAVTGVVQGLNKWCKSPTVEQTEGQDKRKMQVGGREMKHRRK